MIRKWTLDAESMEIRASTDNKPVIRGYAAVFGSLSQPLPGGYRERIERGAFGDSLMSGADIRALWQHDPAQPLGRTTKGTLRLREDDRGLVVEIDPPDTSWGRDAVAAIRRGDVDAMSFGFSVEEQDKSRLVDGTPLRILRRVKLYEVSPVTYPAYPATEVGLRCVVAGDMPAEDASQVAAPDQAAPAPNHALERLKVQGLNVELELLSLEDL